MRDRQTMGGKHPYVFSQCEPIYMRTMAPCQDTPSIKAVCPPLSVCAWVLTSKDT